MLLGGDELGRTQQGNNNAYCQDNEISWFDWADVDADVHGVVPHAGHPAPRPSGVPSPPLVPGSRRSAASRTSLWFRPDGVAMTDDDWDNGYAKSLGVFLERRGDHHHRRLRRPDHRRLVLRAVQRQRARPAVELPGGAVVTAVGGRARQRRCARARHRVRRRRHRHRSCNARSPCCARRNRPRDRPDERETMNMDVDALRGRANELGVEWSYWDIEGRYHESDMEAAAARRRGARGRRGDRAAQLGTGDRRARRRASPVGDGVDQVRLALADGTELELEVSDGAVSFSDVLPDRQPSAVAHRARPRRVDHRSWSHRTACRRRSRSPGAPACSPRPTRCGSTTRRCPPSSTCAASARRCPGSGSTCS